MSAPAVTAAAVKRAFLWPSMDARAHNLRQAQLVENPSPEPDSLLEHLELLESGRLSASSLPELVRLVRDLGASNAAEGTHEVAIATVADGLVSDLRRLELVGRGPKAITAKSIARRLRSPLSHMAQPAAVDPSKLVDAAAAIAAVLRSVPALQLLAPAVEHELGETRFRLLAHLVRSRHKIGAAHLESAGAVAREISHGQR